MLMMGNKKKMASAIVGKMKNSPDFVQAFGEKSDEKLVSNEDPETDSTAGLLAAAGDLISAIKSGDEKGVHRALLNHYEMCKDESAVGDEANSQSSDD